MFIDSLSPERSKRRLRSPMEAISFVTQEYGHVSCWDFETLKELLQKAGFSEIQKTEFRVGRNKTLLIDRDLESRRLVSLYVEAIKQ